MSLGVYLDAGDQKTLRELAVVLAADGQTAPSDGRRKGNTPKSRALTSRLLSDFCERLQVDLRPSDNARSRMIRGEFGKNYLNYLIFFEFIMTHQFVLSSSLSVQSERVFTAHVDRLRESYRLKRLSRSNPFSRLLADYSPANHGNALPEWMATRFVGYRRSSTDGDVVRFYLRLSSWKTSMKSGLIRFVNRYQRGSTGWIVNGRGIMDADETLTLVGEAVGTSGDISRARLGYRFLKLTRVGVSQMLTGPILSQDSEGPIAARVLLIPFSVHDWTVEQRKLIDTFPIRALIEYLVLQPKTNLEKERILVEIADNTRRLFVENFFEDPSQGLFHYISNLTPTVVRAEPDLNDEIIKRELIGRKLARHAEMEYRELLSEVLNSAFKLGPPG